MFFPDELSLTPKKTTLIRTPPPTPETGWTPPTHFPNLAAATIIGFDVETKEPDFSAGPGWARGKGHIVGFSLAAMAADGSRGQWYFPVRHEVEPQYNLEANACFRWLKEQLETPHITKVGANILYDIGWLTEENIWVQGDLYDVQFAEALLYEDGEVNLEYLGQKYAGNGKVTDMLYLWCAEAYGGAVGQKQRENIYRASPRLVGYYAQSDADLPITIMQKQIPLLHRDGLWDVFRMECDLIPLLTKMRMTGVRVDLSRAEQLHKELSYDLDVLQQKMYEMTGFHVNVAAAADLAKAFDTLNLPYKQTSKGSPSFTKEFLNSVNHPFGQLIREVREHIKIRDTFIKSYILDKNHNGRIHCSFHPLRADTGGTRSGRFSSSNPNLQNIPARSTLGKRVRTIFVPDEGHASWHKSDYSQIEYRFLAHFAVGEGASELRAEYNNEPRTDYHDNTFYRLCPFMGWNTDDATIRKNYRKPVKNINFGLLYGMGLAKLSRAIMEYFSGSLSDTQVKALFDAYHAANPYVKATMTAVASHAQNEGYVCTVLGRRSRFNMWEKNTAIGEARTSALPYAAALDAYGTNIIRSNTHKAINRLLQGSAADMIKAGMLQCYKQGIFDVIGVPKLQVHDELDFSVQDFSYEQEQGYREMQRIMENAIPLRIPVLVDSGRGANWGAID